MLLCNNAGSYVKIHDSLLGLVICWFGFLISNRYRDYLKFLHSKICDMGHYSFHPHCILNLNCLSLHSSDHNFGADFLY